MENPAEIFQGPVLIGLVLNIFLFGIAIAQSYVYYTTYKQDQTWMKLCVLVVLITDALNTIFNVISTYLSVITHFGEVQLLDHATWYSATAPATSTIITLIVQFFFTWRIYVLTKNWIPTVLVISLSVVGGVGGFITTHKIIEFPRYSLVPTFRNVVIVWVAAASASDLVITAILVWHLRKHKTGFRTSDLMVDRIIRITMQTGLLTSIVSIVDLTLYLAIPSQGTHMIFNLPLCKLYTNSLLSSLNSRQAMRGCNDPTHTATSNTMDSLIFRQDGKQGSVGRVGNNFTRAVNFLESRSEKQQVFVQVESHETG